MGGPGPPIHAPAVRQAPLGDWTSVAALSQRTEGTGQRRVSRTREATTNPWKLPSLPPFSPSMLPALHLDGRPIRGPPGGVSGRLGEVEPMEKETRGGGAGTRASVQACVTEGQRRGVCPCLTSVLLSSGRGGGHLVRWARGKHFSVQKTGFRGVALCSAQSAPAQEPHGRLTPQPAGSHTQHPAPSSSVGAWAGGRTAPFQQVY